MRPYFLFYIFTQWLFIVHGYDKSKTNTNKPILRYGFQRTKECQDFQRAFLCVRKCLDLHYDIAHADKNCVCTCFYRRDKAKYTPVVFGQSTKWRLGAPTTSVPAWAQPHKVKLLGKGYLDVSHELGGFSEEQRDAGNSTVIELSQTTESGTVATDAGENSTFKEGATSEDADNSTGVADNTVGVANSTDEVFTTVS